MSQKTESLNAHGVEMSCLDTAGIENIASCASRYMTEKEKGGKDMRGRPKGVKNKPKPEIKQKTE